MERKKIDVEELKKVFRLKDGNLERFHKWKNKHDTWKIVENKANTNGYCYVKFNSTQIYYHVILWILSTGKDIPKGAQIDHINGNRIDNRFENLRLVTSRVNNQNRKQHREGQLFGCNFNKRDNKYQAQIWIGNKHVYLGYYDTEEEAHNVYVTACQHVEEYVDTESFRELIKQDQK